MTRNGRSFWFALDYRFLTLTRLKIFVLFLVYVLPCTLGARSNHSRGIKKGSLTSAHSRWPLTEKQHPLLTSSTSALRKARIFQLLAQNRAALVKALQSVPDKDGKKKNYKALIDNHLQNYTTQLKEDEDALVRSTRCSNKMDLAFVMGGCGARSFDTCAQFVKSVIKDLEVNRHDTRIGVVLFSRRAKVLFGFRDFSTLAEILHALDHIKYRVKRPGKTVSIGRALQVARDKLFSKARKDVPRTLVLVTGGEAQDDVLTPANHLRTDGVEVYGVGLGRGFRVHQLKAVATQPVAKHVFTQSVLSRAGVLRSLRTIVCRSKTVKHDNGNEPSQYEDEPASPATLVFLLDGSKHLTEKNFRTIKHFLNSVLRNMVVASDALKIGIAECGDDSGSPPEMVMYESVEQIEDELDGITKISGKCQVGYSIQKIEQEAFDVTPNDTARILVAILAGKSDDDVAKAAEELKRKSVRVMVLGVGQTVDKAQMEDIAENPVYALKVPLFDYLTAMTSTVATFIEQAVYSSMSTDRKAVESLIFSVKQNDERENELLESEAESDKATSEGNATAVDSWESAMQQSDAEDPEGSGVREEGSPAQQGTGTSLEGTPAQPETGTSEEGSPAQPGTGTSSSSGGPGAEGVNAAEMSQSGARVAPNVMASTGGSSPNQGGVTLHGQNPVATNIAPGSNAATSGSSGSSGPSGLSGLSGSSASVNNPGNTAGQTLPGSSGSTGSSGSSVSVNSAANTAGQISSSSSAKGSSNSGNNAESPGPAAGQVTQPVAQGVTAQGSAGQGSVGVPGQSVSGQGSSGQVAPAAGQAPAASYPAQMMPFQISMLPAPKSSGGRAPAPSISLPVMQAIPLIPMAAVSPDTPQVPSQSGENAPKGNQFPSGGIAPSTPENPQGNSPQYGPSPQPAQTVGGPQPSKGPEESKEPQAKQPQSPSQPQNQGPDQQAPPDSQKPGAGAVASPGVPSGGENKPNLPPNGGTGGGGEGPPGKQRKGEGSSSSNTANPCVPVPTTKPTEKPTPKPKPCAPTTEAPKKPKPPKQSPKTPPVLPPVGPMPHFPPVRFPFPHPHFLRPHFPHPHFPMPHHRLHYFSSEAPVEQPILIGQCQDYDPECPAFKMAGKCEEPRSTQSEINVQELCALTCGLCNRFVKIGDEVTFDLRHNRPKVHPKVTEFFPEYNRKFLRSIISHHWRKTHNNNNGNDNNNISVASEN